MQIDDEDDETGQTLITMFRTAISEPVLQRTVAVFQHFQVEYHQEMHELLQHACIQHKFELVLKNLERFVWEFILQTNIPAQLSEAEKSLGLDLTRTFFYRIRSYILHLEPPVH